MLDLHRGVFKPLELFLGKLLSKLPFSPNLYTISSIPIAILALFLSLHGFFFFSLLLFALAAFLDFVDGAVARAKNVASKRGAYLDTIIDRYIEALWIFSFFFLPLGINKTEKFVLIFFVLFGSLMTTYAKASAKEKGLVKKELKGGILSRAERIFMYFFISLFSIFSSKIAVLLLIILALLSNITAFQRIISAL